MDAPIDPKLAAKIIAMDRDGLGWVSIAALLGIGIATVERVLADVVIVDNTTRRP